jgi:hypothetical protein
VQNAESGEQSTKNPELFYGLAPMSLFGRVDFNASEIQKYILPQPRRVSKSAERSKANGYQLMLCSSTS